VRWRMIAEIKTQRVLSRAALPFKVGARAWKRLVLNTPILKGPQFRQALTVIFLYLFAGYQSVTPLISLV